MSENFGPFATGPGAILTAEDWGNIFGLIQSPGVVPGVDDELEVYADGSGYLVRVRSGGAWVNGFGYRLAAEEKTLTINPPNATLDRIDRIVLELDVAQSTIGPTVLTGTPSATPVAPSLTQESLTYQVPLARVSVIHGVGTIAADKVTDERQYAASNAARRSRTAWLPAGAFAVTSGTATYSDVMGATQTDAAWVLPATTNVRLGSSWLVPSDWTSGAVDVTAWWAADNTNNGTVRWTYRIGGPSAFDTGIAVVSGTVDNTGPGIANNARLAGLTSFTPTAAGQLVGIGFGRDGAVGADNFTGNAYFYGVRLTYSGQ